MRLNALQNEVLANVENALRESSPVDVGVLSGFNAGVEHIVRQNRSPTDSEMLGLENLADQVVPGVHANQASEGGDVSVPSLAPEPPSEDSSVTVEAVPETAGGTVAQHDDAPGTEVTQLPAEETTSAPVDLDPDFSQPGERDIGVVSSEALFGGEEAHDEPAEVDEDDGA